MNPKLSAVSARLACCAVALLAPASVEAAGKSKRSAAKTKPAATAPAKPAQGKFGPPREAETPPPPKKKSGGFLGLFGGDDDEDENPAPAAAPQQPAPPSRTVPKTTAKPAAVKPVPAPAAPVKPAVKQVPVKSGTPAAPPAAVEPVKKKSGGFLGLFGGDDDEEEKPAASSSSLKDEDKPLRPDDWETRSIVEEEETKFFRNGPLQHGGADDHLAVGTVVKVVKSGKGWSQIQLESGLLGYIGTSQMRPASENDFRLPPRPVPATNPADFAAVLPSPELPDLPESPGPSDGAASLLLPAPEP